MLKNAVFLTRWCSTYAATRVFFIIFVLGLAGCVTNLPEEPVETASADKTDAQANTVATIKYYPPYQVKPGEWLSTIANRVGLDYKLIAEWNRIAPPYNLSVGQILLLAPPGHKLNNPDARDEPLVPRISGVLPKHPPGDDVQSYDGTPLPRDHTANDWDWPTEGRVVQRFNRRNHTKHGIRIAGNFRQKIVAAESGRVIFSGDGLPRYGQLIIIKHAKNYLSVYGFNDKILVQEGSMVEKGQPIAEMGHSMDGKPMLHFEIRRKGKVLDPLRLLPAQ